MKLVKDAQDLFGSDPQRGQLVTKNGDKIDMFPNQDGTFTVSSKMGSVVLTREQIQQLVSERAKQHLPEDDEAVNPAALIGSDRDYDSVKEAMASPDIKDKVLKGFSDFVRLCQEGKYKSDKPRAGEDVAEAIVEYPKVLVENHYDADYDHMWATFASVGSARLPFPRMVVISGDYTEHIDNSESVIRLEKSNKVNVIYAFYMSQKEDHISVDLLFGKKDKNFLYFRNFEITHNGAGLKIHETLPVIDNDANLIGFIRTAIIALYKMTLGGGEMMVSIPTPEEIAINRKRIHKGKKPLVEFRLINIESKVSLPSVPHGSHASPRLHWRRGHWRTAPKSGKKVWIDPMLVGDEENGKIIKDYAIGKYKEERKH